MGKLRFVAGFALGALFFAACGTAEVKFPYKWFHLSPISTWEVERGELVGDGVRLPLKDCKPRRDAQGKLVQVCAVVFYDELNRVIVDYKQTKQALVDCQRGIK